MGKLYENSEGDVELVSDNGVWYELQDASTNRSNKSYDLYHVLVDISPFISDTYDPDDFDIYDYMAEYNIDDYVGRAYGTDLIYYPDPSMEDFKYDFKYLNDMVREYELDNPQIMEIFADVPIPSDWKLLV